MLKLGASNLSKKYLSKLGFAHDLFWPKSICLNWLNWKSICRINLPDLATGCGALHAQDDVRIPGAAVLLPSQALPASPTVGVVGWFGHVTLKAGFGRA